MAAFDSLSSALAYLGKECVVVSTGEHGKLCSIQAEGPEGDSCLEVPFGFYRPVGDVEPVLVVESLSLALSPTSVAVGADSTATATATYDDSSTGTVSAELVSATPAVATIVDGKVHGVSAGTSLIVANFAGKESSGVTLTVTE